MQCILCECYLSCWNIRYQIWRIACGKSITGYHEFWSSIISSFVNVSSYHNIVIITSYNHKILNISSFVLTNLSLHVVCTISVVIWCNFGLFINLQLSFNDSEYALAQRRDRIFSNVSHKIRYLKHVRWNAKMGNCEYFVFKVETSNGGAAFEV